MSDKTNSLNEVKTELKSGLIAIGLATIGGLMLVGAAALFILPILNGEEPYTVLAIVLGVIGAIVELIGDWKMISIKFKQDKRKWEQRLNK